MSEDTIEKSATSKEDVVEKTSTPATEAQTKKRRGKRHVLKGQARILSTYNNTVVTVTDLNGAVLGWSSAGVLGFKGAKKSTPYAATQVVNDVVEKIAKHGMKELQIYVKGVGSGRDAAMRAFAAQGFAISLIKDTTPKAHNGCRRRKPRRV